MALVRPPQISTDPGVNASALAAINFSFDRIEEVPKWIFVPTFQNSWSSNVAAPDGRAVRMYRDATGTVFLAGQATKGTLPGGNETIFALPKRWSPANSFNVIVSASNIPVAVAEISIGGGVVQFVSVQAGVAAPLFLHIVAVFKGEI